jgi:hypothetical protein
MDEKKEYMVVKLLSPAAKFSVVPYVEIRPGIEEMVFGPATQEACEEHVKNQG